MQYNCCINFFEGDKDDTQICLCDGNSVDVIAIPPETVPDCFGSFRNFPLLLLSHAVGNAGDLTVTN